jgi:hypothetical protein
MGVCPIDKAIEDILFGFYKDLLIIGGLRDLGVQVHKLGTLGKRYHVQSVGEPECAPPILPQKFIGFNIGREI